MSAELKYTTNFPNPESGGTYSGTDLPACSDNDIGKVVGVVEKEPGRIGYDLVSGNDPIVFHAEADNPMNPFGGGLITESRAEVEAAYGKQAVVTITTLDGTNFILPIVWLRSANVDYVAPTASAPIVYNLDWAYLVVNFNLSDTDNSGYQWSTQMFALTPIS